MYCVFIFFNGASVLIPTAYSIELYVMPKDGLLNLLSACKEAIEVLTKWTFLLQFGCYKIKLRFQAAKKFDENIPLFLGKSNIIYCPSFCKNSSCQYCLYTLCNNRSMEMFWKKDIELNEVCYQIFTSLAGYATLRRAIKIT